jgi:hypothetical protein
MELPQGEDRRKEKKREEEKRERDVCPILESRRSIWRD